MKRAKENIKHGALRGSATKGERNLIGYLGEEIFLRYYKTAIRCNTYDYDFLLGKLKVDIKTSQITERPKHYFNNDVYAFNLTQACDYYYFIQILQDMSTGFLIGYLSKKDFFEKARLRKKGQKASMKSTKILVADSYSVKNMDIFKPKYNLKEIQ